MNYQQRREYSSIWQSRVRIFERKYQAQIQSVIKAQYDKILAIIKEKGFQAALKEIDFYIIDANMGEILMDLYQDVGGFLIKKYKKEIAQQLRGAKSYSSDSNYQIKGGVLGVNPDWVQFILQYFRNNLLIKAVLQITQTSRREIMAVVRQAIQEGWGYDEMASHIDTLPRWRAKMIARTETLMATAAARNFSIQDTPFELTKEWVTAHDNRVRFSHQLVDGRIINENEMFTVGFEECTGPGDPNLSAKQAVNCRCVVAFAPKRDENGRLIPK